MAYLVLADSANKVFRYILWMESVFAKTLKYQIVRYSHVLTLTIGAGWKLPPKGRSFQPEYFDDDVFVAPSSKWVSLAYCVKLSLCGMEAFTIN